MNHVPSPQIAVVTGDDRNAAVPIIGHAAATTIASRLARIATIMADCVDVEPHPDEAAWSIVVTGDAHDRNGREHRRPAAVVTPYHTNGPIGAQIPPTASWIIAPVGEDGWRETGSPVVRRIIVRGDLAGRVSVEREDDGTPPHDALRIVLPGYGGGPVMIHPTPQVLRECARFAALAADAVAGRVAALTLEQWNLVVTVASFGSKEKKGANKVAHTLVHNAGHPLRSERLVRITHDFSHVVPRHTTLDLTPPGAPRAMLLTLGDDPFVPTLEPVDVDELERRPKDAMSILRAIEAMRTATGWTPPGRAEP